ncbi:MAG: hypothetical protein AAFV53_36940 [Myxococcota bacterium]
MSTQPDSGSSEENSNYTGVVRFFVDLFQREAAFLTMLSVSFLIIALTYNMPGPARWIGFLLAGYAAVANDSIQTIGTFIASNKEKPWWMLWIFIGGIFLATVTYSWMNYGGDVSYGRLTSKGFEHAPTSFSFLQVAAPLFLIILTRLRMPVSTTFLLLSSFAAKSSSIGSIMMKSLSGYFLAFGIAIVVFFAAGKMLDAWIKRGPAHPAWRVFQWITSGLLWSVWIMQDAANIAVYLPRSLSLLEFIGFATPVFLGLGFLFYSGGERIQQIVDEKSSVVDVRAATVIDLIYAVILYYFKIVSEIPMSTTWVFLGLLGGRELAMSLRSVGERSWMGSLALIGKDAGFAAIGLIVSLIIAMAVNDTVRAGLLESIGF